MPKIFLFIVFLLSAATEVSRAQSIPLLSEVTDKQVIADVRTKNDYFLKQHLYTAKRHKIVHANVDSLLSGQPIQIPLFQGETVTVLPSEIRGKNGDALIMWSGTIESPSKSVGELTSQYGNQKRAERTFEALHGLDIAAARFQHDVEFDANFPYYTPSEQPTRKESEQDSPSAGPIFYGLTANIQLADLRAWYALRPLEMGGAYHVLYEIDPEKLITPEGYGSTGDSEMEEKRAAARAFIESLGEDPRKEIIRVKRERQQ